MKLIFILPTLLIVFTSLAFFIKSLLTPDNLDVDLQDEDYHMYL